MIDPTSYTSSPLVTATLYIVFVGKKKKDNTNVNRDDEND